MEYTPTEIAGAVIGLGLVLKGIIDQLARTRKVDDIHRCRCQFDKHAFDNLEMHMQKQDIKHDEILMILKGGK